MLTSHTNHRVRKSQHGLTFTNKTTGSQIEARLQENGLTLEGDGFGHSIQIQDKTVSISRLDGESKPVTFRSEVFLEDSQRLAIGVASVLTGISPNLFTGEKSEPVYLRLSNRGGMGRRKDGSRMGGRYRVKKLDREITGTVAIDIKPGTFYWSGERGPRTGIAQFVGPTGRHLKSTSAAFQQLTGHEFHEQVQGGLAEVWRQAGRPQSIGEAAKVVDYVFDTLYHAEPKSGYYSASPETKAVLYRLESHARSNPEAAWQILSESAKRKLDSGSLLEILRES